LYFTLFYHVFYRITVIGWSALAVVSRYCQILLLLLLLLSKFVYQLTKRLRFLGTSSPRPLP